MNNTFSLDWRARRFGLIYSKQRNRKQGEEEDQIHFSSFFIILSASRHGARQGRRVRPPPSSDSSSDSTSTGFQVPHRPPRGQQHVPVRGTLRSFHVARRDAGADLVEEACGVEAAEWRAVAAQSYRLVNVYARRLC